MDAVSQAAPPAGDMRRSSPGTKGLLAVAPPSLTALIRGHEFFRQVRPEVVAEVISSVHIHRAALGDVLVQEGEAGRSLFLLLSGSVLVQSERSETRLAHLQAGSFFGEIGALYNVARTATVQVDSPAGATVAVLLGTALVGALRAHPEALREIAHVAQERYAATRPALPRPGHVGSAHYLAAMLKSTFPALFDAASPAAVEEFVAGCGFLKKERNASIVAFARPDEPSKAFFVLRGAIRLFDPLLAEGGGAEGKGALFPTGSVASFEDGSSSSPSSSFLAYMVAHGDETSDGILVLATSGEAHRKLLSNAASLDSKEARQPLERDSDHPVAVRPLINAIGENLTGRRGVRRASVDAVFGYSQELHGRAAEARGLSPGGAAASLGPASPTMMEACRVLYSCGIHVADPARIMPNYDTSKMDFSSIFNLLTDDIIATVSASFGPTLTCLNVAGSPITDGVLGVIVARCPNLQEINVSDCILLSCDGLCGLFRGCRGLTALNVSNCYGFTDRCFEAMAGLRLASINVSYCRNVSCSIWRLLCTFNETLESITMHRMISLQGDAISGDFAPFPRLTRLDLTDCAFLTTRALRSLLQRMPSLEELRLTFCTGLDDNILKALVELEDCPMRALDMSFCVRAVTDRTIAGWARCLPGLQWANIQGSRYATPSALESLLRIPSLKVVNARSCPLISAEALADAAQRGHWNERGPLP